MRPGRGLAAMPPVPARFRNVNMQGVKMVDALLANADLSGMIVGLKVNGIEVAPLIAAEMERPHPERKQVIACLWTVIDEEWAHNLIANRDLDRLGSSG